MYIYLHPHLPHIQVREQVGLTEAPCLECATDVLHEMRKVQRDATEAVKLLNAFPVAKAAISQKCNEILQEQHAECVKYLQTHVAMNQLRISYGHPDFHKDRILFEVEQKRHGTEDSEDDVALMVKMRQWEGRKKRLKLWHGVRMYSIDVRSTFCQCFYLGFIAFTFILPSFSPLMLVLIPFSFFLSSFFFSRLGQARS